MACNTTTMMLREDRQDTRRALAVHSPDGEWYVVEYCSLWSADAAVGTRIIRAAGPIAHRDLLPEGGPLERSRAVYDRVDAWPGLSAEDADWLQAEEDAGRLSYPVGGR